MGAVGDLQALAAEYLAAVEDAVALAPGGPIARTFVSPGVPAFDCPEQIAVHVGGPSVIPTEPSQGITGLLREEYRAILYLVQLTATVTRCAPTMRKSGDTYIPPAEDQLTTAALVANGDLWSVWNHCRTLHRDGNLFPPVNPGGRREIEWLTPLTIPPQGGVCGWQIAVRVELDGYGL